MIRPRFTISILFASLAIVACDSNYVEKTNVTVAPPSLESSRFAVTILSEFDCDLAYGGKRRIYEITDTKTGAKYLGITGLGLGKMRADEDADAIADSITDIGD